MPPEKPVTIRIGHGKADWFQTGKGVGQGYILSPWLFNLYAECIMCYSRLDETQAGIKNKGRNINSLRICRWHHPYGKKQRGMKQPLHEGEREDWKSLKLNFQSAKIMASGPITSWQIDGETVETVTDFIWGAPKSLQMVTAAMKLKHACSLEEELWPT